MAFATKEQEKAYSRAYYLAHREEIKARTREWAKTHQEHVSEWQKGYRESHKEEIVSYKKSYYRDHSKEDNARCKAWRASHQEEKASKDKDYYELHKEKIKSHVNEKYESNKKEAVCVQCGKLSKVREKFCSQKCYHAWHIGENTSTWKGGISFEPYCPKFNNEFKRRVRAFFGDQCVLCGKTATENKMKLHVHHVEYNKQACCDGKPVHFAALCASCHSKTTHGDRQRWENMIHAIIEEVYNGRSYFTKEESEAI